MVNISGFHSINVPSEWGRYFSSRKHSLCFCFHSINVPSEWGLVNLYEGKQKLNCRFHSINVPSEWGLIESGDGAGLNFDGFPFN